MGDIQGIGQADERPVCEVWVDEYWMIRTEVTRGMLGLFLEDAAYETASECWVPIFAEPPCAVDLVDLERYMGRW